MSADLPFVAQGYGCPKCGSILNAEAANCDWEWHAGTVLRPLTPEWRLWHVERGDELLAHVNDLVDPAARPDLVVMALATLAQAHYAAANVRARPALE